MSDGNCLSCGSKLVTDIVKIGEQYPSAIYPRTQQDLDDLFQSSLNLSICSDPGCSLVQLTEISDLDSVFAKYPYESGSTATMNEKLKDLSLEAARVSGLTDQDVVLDVGGNDGTLLSHFNARYRVNIDAAHGVGSVIDEPNDLKVVSPYSFSVYRQLDLPAPKLITSVAMFYHLSEPAHFCREIAAAMSSDTVFCLQMTYLGGMYEQNSYDNIVHEHRAYYSLHSLARVYAQAGLVIYGARVVNSYGGSIRVYAGLQKDRAFDPELKAEYHRLLALETKTQMNSVSALIRFNERCQLLKQVTRHWIDAIVDRDGPIAGFGASTKGNMIVQFLGLTPKEMTCVYDNGPRKIGTKLVGSGIPIFDERECGSMSGNNFLVLPYYYFDFFKTLIPKFIPKGQKKYLMSPNPVPHMKTIEGTRV